jgi:hypothetical protein
MSNVRLRHSQFKDTNAFVFFYDGQLRAKDGVLEVPADREPWVKRAWMVLGYNQKEDGTPLPKWSDVQAYMNESAKSVKETPIEGADAERQPDITDGLRESKSKDERSVPFTRPRSRRNSSVAKEREDSK